MFAIVNRGPTPIMRSMETSALRVRAETVCDADSIKTTTIRAFSESELGYHGEADLIDRLRRSCPETVSLVAEVKGQVVGHILLSPVVIVAPGARESRELSGMGLAPMSVLPEFQRQGIGSQLVESGLRTVREAGHPFVVVLGHAEYYPRFGFVPASRWGISSEYAEVPEDTFLICVFSESDLTNVRGIAKYRPEFGLL